MLARDPAAAPSKADMAYANAEFACEELDRLTKQFALETAERWKDEIEKIGVSLDTGNGITKPHPLHLLLQETLCESVIRPNPEQAAEDA